MPFADAYTFRARVQPAFIVVLPLVILLFALLPELPIFVSAFVGILGATGGTAVLAQVGRELGRRKEPGLWKSWGRSAYDTFASPSPNSRRHYVGV